MPVFARRALVLAAIAMLALPDLVHAQSTSQDSVELPQITVRAPSPIVRRTAQRPAAGPAQGPAQAPAPLAVTVTPNASLPGTLPGNLPIVSDQFATVTVVPREEIARSPGTTLGDLLFSKPGITGSSFAPGAIEPADRARARRQPCRHCRQRHRQRRRVGSGRGPFRAGRSAHVRSDRGDPRPRDAALRLAVDRRRGECPQQPHPRGDALPGRDRDDQRLRAVRDARRVVQRRPRHRRRDDRRYRRGQLRLSRRRCSGAARGTTASRAIPISTPPISTRWRRSPATSTAGSRTPRTRSNGASVGGSYFFGGGYAGLAVTQNNSLYRIPGPEGEITGTRIDAEQTKVTSKGEFRPQHSAIDTVRFWFGATDYKHNEVGFATPGDPATDGVRQTFTNKEQEGRVEVQFAPFRANFAGVTTAVGVQAGHQRLTATEPGRSGEPAQRAVRSQQKHPRRRLHLQRVRVQPDDQGADRRPHRARRSFGHDALGRSRHLRRSELHRPDCGAGPELHAEERERRPHPEPAVARPRRQASRRNTSSARRKPAELFSRGPHEATATFDIGDPNLRIEKARSVEVGLAQAHRPVPFRGDGLLHALQRLHLPQAHRQHLRRRLMRRSGRSGGAAGAQPGALHASATPRSAAANSSSSGTSIRCGAASSASRGNTTSCARRSPTAPTCRASRRSASAAALYFRSAAWLARVNILHAFSAGRRCPGGRDADRRLQPARRRS